MKMQRASEEKREKEQWKVVCGALRVAERKSGQCGDESE
jgi:hypothetical protein